MVSFKLRSKASFAVYGAKGQNVSAKDLKAVTDKFLKDAATVLSKNFNIERKNFNVTTDLTAKIYNSETDAIKSGKDNIVEVGYEQIIDKSDGGTALGMAFGVKGENFDRMVITTVAGFGEEATTGGGFGYQARQNEGTNTTFAHEFAAHLLSGFHNTVESNSFFYSPKGGSDFTDRDFVRLMTGKGVVEPPPNARKERSVFENLGLLQGAKTRFANNRNNESPSAVYEWRKHNR